MTRIELLVKDRIAQMRCPDAGQELKGLVITEQEIDLLMAQPVGEAWEMDRCFFRSGDAASILENLTHQIESQKSESRRRGIALRLSELTELMALSRLELDILLIALAPELDQRFERLYAYLQDDVTRKRPSVDLTLGLTCPSMGQRLEARSKFAPDAPLIKHRLLSLFGDPSQQMPTLLSRYLKVDDNIVNYLLGVEDMHAEPYIRRAPMTVEWGELLFEDDFKQRLSSLMLRIDEYENRAVFHFQGQSGIGKKSAADSLCRGLGYETIFLNLERLATLPSTDAETALQLAARNACINRTALYFEHLDALDSERHVPLQKALGAILDHGPRLIFLSGEQNFDQFEALKNRSAIQIVFPRPDAPTRRRLWKRALNDESLVLDPEIDISAVANKFRLTGGQIKAAAKTARNLARWRDPENGVVKTGDIYGACRAKSNQRLSSLAKKISPHYVWEDIVLPPDGLSQLKEICSTVKHSALVYETWGFERKLAMSKGTNILFSGPSGTGKTMAADIMANVLGLDLYKIDLSGIVSKYIGETEKNLSKIFTEAETSNAILFFDEADALFGKRTEVRDSHDRFANIEISYLLQKMEEYEGVVILATNLQKNMDEAFVRRMQFTIEFPLPGKKERQRIWEGIWPREIPRSDDLDLEFMAKQFEMAGGNIKNIALAAAFYAADDGHCVDMRHLVRATLREYQKMGKIVMDRELGRYAGMKGTK